MEQYPDYLLVSSTFNTIFETEDTESYHQLVKLIKTHPLNRRGDFYKNFREKIVSYELYLSIKESNEKKVLEALESYLPVNRCQMDVRLVHKLLVNHEKISDKILEHLKCYMLVDLLDTSYYPGRIDVIGEQMNCYFTSEMLQELQKEFKFMTRNEILFRLLTYTYNRNYVRHSIDNFWKIVNIFDKNLKIEFLDWMIKKMRNELYIGGFVFESIIRDDCINICYYIIEQLNLNLTIYSYADSCLIGNYKCSLNILSRLIQDKKDKYEKLTGIFPRKSSYLIEALRNSISSGNKELEDFNKLLLDKFYNRKINNEDIDEIIDELNESKRDNDQFYDALEKFTYDKSAKTIRQIVNELEYYYSRDSMIHIFFSHSPDPFIFFQVLFYLCHRIPDIIQKFYRTTADEDSARLFDIIVCNINEQLCDEIMNSSLTFCKGVKKIIFEYNQYT